MQKDVVILIVEDDDGHFSLINKNLHRAGLWNETIRFADGQQFLDFFVLKGQGARDERGRAYILILDIRIPKVDGVMVLEKIKQDSELKKIPVIVLTTADDPKMVEHCHSLGCSLYIVKPVQYEDFIETIRRVSLFLSAVEVPKIIGSKLKTGVVK